LHLALEPGVLGRHAGVVAHAQEFVGVAFVEGAARLVSGDDDTIEIGKQHDRRGHHGAEILARPGRVVEVRQRRGVVGHERVLADEDAAAESLEERRRRGPRRGVDRDGGADPRGIVRSPRREVHATGSPGRDETGFEDKLVEVPTEERVMDLCEDGPERRSALALLRGTLARLTQLPPCRREIVLEPGSGRLRVRQVALRSLQRDRLQLQVGLGLPIGHLGPTQGGDGGIGGGKALYGLR